MLVFGHTMIITRENSGARKLTRVLILSGTTRDSECLSSLICWLNVSIGVDSLPKSEESIDICVVEPEDRVESRGWNNGPELYLD